MPKLVVLLLLLGVRQNLIGLGGLLEFILRCGVAGILVGVELNRKLAVCLFNLLGRASSGYSQYGVVIALTRGISFLGLRRPWHIELFYRPRGSPSRAHPRRNLLKLQKGRGRW